MKCPAQHLGLACELEEGHEGSHKAAFASLNGHRDVRCHKCEQPIDQATAYCGYPVGHRKAPNGGLFHIGCCPWHSGADRSVSVCDWEPGAEL